MTLWNTSEYSGVTARFQSWAQVLRTSVVLLAIIVAVTRSQSILFAQSDVYINSDPLTPPNPPAGFLSVESPLTCATNGGAADATLPDGGYFKVSSSGGPQLRIDARASANGSCQYWWAGSPLGNPQQRMMSYIHLSALGPFEIFDAENIFGNASTYSHTFDTRVGSGSPEYTKGALAEGLRL